MRKIVIRVEPGAERETRALYRALRGDPDLRRTVTLSVQDGGVPSEGDLGAVSDSILAVVNGSAALGALIVSIAAWRDARRTTWTVSLEEEGLRVELRGSSREELERVIRTLEGPRGGAA